ncbi:hypothetical protein K3495_g12615 [Podosphaera aphanis]|nr:hypothetical protein K3495_g12615 [Podosphaera aphanis]
MHSFYILTVITALVSSVVASSQVNNKNSQVLDKRAPKFHVCGHLRINDKQVKMTFKAGCNKLKEYLSGKPGSLPPIEIGKTENQITIYGELVQVTKNDPNRMVYAVFLMDKAGCQRLSLDYRTVPNGRTFLRC